MRISLPSLRRAAVSCKGCELYERATQTVFGEGPIAAEVMLVGEIPGDREDLEGAPFVGPAGRLLDDALQAAGLQRDNVYITNAVKHFCWEERGKRRLHKKPRWRHVQACKPWLDAEIAVVKPKIIVCLGATAAHALVGPGFRISKNRGRLLVVAGLPRFMATYHPAAILRAPLRSDQVRMKQEFEGDLVQAIASLDESLRATK